MGPLKIKRLQELVAMYFLLQAFFHNKDHPVFKLTMAYWAFDFNEKATLKFYHPIELIQKWSLFCPNPDPLPAKAADELIWGFLENVEEIITKHPHVLVLNTEAKDHISSVQDTLYQMARKLGDNVIKDKQGRTMQGMIEQHLRKRFGDDEVQKQENEIRQFLEDEEKKSVAKRADDKKAIDDVLKSLKVADEKALATDAKLIDAVDLCERHLSTPGDWHVLMYAEKKFKENYYNFGGYKNPKNNFFEDRILGLIQICRMRAWELQVVIFGVRNYKDGVVVPRVDVRLQAGLNPDSNRKLGRHFSCDIFGPLMLVRGRGPGPSWLDIDTPVPLLCWETFFKQKHQLVLRESSPNNHEAQRETIVRSSAVAMIAGR